MALSDQVDSLDAQTTRWLGRWIAPVRRSRARLRSCRLSDHRSQGCFDVARDSCSVDILSQRIIASWQCALDCRWSDLRTYRRQALERALGVLRGGPNSCSAVLGAR